jgi:hypothetical protein
VAGAAGVIVAAVVVGLIATSGNPKSSRGGRTATGVTSAPPTTAPAHEAFTVEPTQVKAGQTVTVSAQGPCPRLPSGFSPPARADIEIQRDPTDPNTVVGSSDVGLDAAGRWSTQVPITDSAVAGNYSVLARCEAMQFGGFQGYYQGYATQHLAVTG